MTLPLFLVHLAGAIFLLLYAVRMVRTGVERASGPGLRRVLIGDQRGRVPSAMVGLVIAILLQSATATAILTVGFVAGGLIPFMGGLSILLGADLGSALVVQVLSFRLDWLIPVLLAFGGWMFLRFDGRQAGQIGRVLLGIAFILLSLGMISQASQPMQESTLVPLIASYLDKEVATAFVLGVVVAFVMHSSVAMILLCATLATHHVVSTGVGAALVLGANLGGALLPIWLTRNVAPHDRRIVFANTALRGLGAIGALMLLLWFPELVQLPDWPPGQVLVTVHVVFNLAVLLLGLATLGLAERLSQRFIPRPLDDGTGTLGMPKSALDPAVLGTPSLALAGILREVLRMGDMVETMVAPVMDVFSKGSDAQVTQTIALEREVNKAFDDIRRYTHEMNRVGLSKREAKQARELTDYSINLEAAADRVVKSLLRLAAEKQKKQLRFSDSGWKELREAHAMVAANIRLALNVLVSEDIDAARRLVEEKANLTAVVRSSRKRHLKRLGSGQELSFETSDIHLETLNTLKEINSLFAAVAYPILYRANLMLDTKLLEKPEVETNEKTDDSI